MPKILLIELKLTLFVNWFFSAKLTTSSKIQPNVRRKSTSRKNGFWQWFRHRSEQKFEKAMGGILPFLLPNLSTRCVFIWYHIFRIFHWRFCDSHFTFIPWFLDSEEHFRKNYGEQKPSNAWLKCPKLFHLFKGRSTLVELHRWPRRIEMGLWVPRRNLNSRLSCY